MLLNPSHTLLPNISYFPPTNPHTESLDQTEKWINFLWGKFSIFYWIDSLASAFQFISTRFNPTLCTLQMPLPLPLKNRKWLKKTTHSGLQVSL